MRKLFNKVGLTMADVILSWFALAVAVLIAYGCQDISSVISVRLVPFIVGCAVLTAAIPMMSYLFKIYAVVWRFASLEDLMKLVLSTTSAYVLFFCMHYVIIGQSIKFRLSVYAVAFMLTGILSVGLRLLVRLSYRTPLARTRMHGAYKRIMIIGAGSACALLLRDIKLNTCFSDSKVECLIDDDELLRGKSVYGVTVAGNRDAILENAVKYNISTIIFAIPTCSSSDRAAILGICSKTGCQIKTLPSIDQIIEKGYKETSIRDVEIDDLLGRDPIHIDNESIINYVSGKVVMVTGGGGSIGSELCRQIAAHNPKRLIIFDIYENTTYDILNELKRKYPELDIIALIGSVRDTNRLDCVFSKYRPQLVYHAAAHKHVPLMEDSPHESVKNNVFGTLNTVQMADKYLVERFVMISTDKAVNPTNIMGATKRICEMIIQYYNKYSSTDFVAVRFGNVLGSNGSVIPLFKKQIAEGGPVTVTHPDIIRYFMTIPEAVSLVLQAGAVAKGGEIFVLDMGKPVKILDLAENLIRLSGFEPYTDIDIIFSGLRPGEKLFEELLTAEEGLNVTENNLIYRCRPIELDEEAFFDTLHRLKAVVADDRNDIFGLMCELVPTFEHKAPKSENKTERHPVTV